MLKEKKQADQMVSCGNQPESLKQRNPDWGRGGGWSLSSPTAVAGDEFCL